MISLNPFIISLFLVSAMCSCTLAQHIENDQLPESPVPICGHLNPTDIATASSSVEFELASLSFVLVRGNATSSLDMAVVSPSGAVFDSAAQMPVIYGENKTLTFIIIPEPELGIWSAEITGISVPEQGEDYCVYVDYEVANEELLLEPNLSYETVEICETCD